MYSTTVKSKIIIAGDFGVGKTSILIRFTQDQFNEDPKATVGTSFATKSLNVGGASVELDIWDTAGQERFGALAPMYYLNADAAIVVYDITNNESFVNVKSWIEKVQKAVQDAVIAIVGSKTDKSDERQVKTEEAQNYAKDNGFIFAEVSAKTGEGVSGLMETIAERVRSRSEYYIH